jgi:hypothetical protein
MKTSCSPGALVAVPLAMICTIGGANLIDEAASRPTLFRQLSIETDGKRISAFAQERSRKVRLPPAHRPGNAAREERCAAGWKRLSRAA